jgi:hypothetical protein
MTSAYLRLKAALVDLIAALMKLQQGGVNADIQQVYG